MNQEEKVKAFVQSGSPNKRGKSAGKRIIKSDTRERSRPYTDSNHERRDSDGLIWDVTVEVSVNQTLVSVNGELNPIEEVEERI